MALQTYNSINLKESISDNGLDLHCWIETNDGQIIDEDFEMYDFVKQVRNLTGDKIHCELVGENKKKIWKYIYKNHIKELKILKILEILDMIIGIHFGRIVMQEKAIAL